jgi:hypothetical protein
METPITDTSLDDVILAYIDEASSLIIKEYRREFAPASTAVTRRFRLYESGQGRRANLTPYDLRNPTSVVLHPETSNPLTLSSSDYELEPFVNSEGVYTSLRISPWIAIVSLKYLKFGAAYIDITGDWGFATVPSQVKRAAVITVRTWVRKDARAMAGSLGGNYYSGQELTPDMPSTYALPAAARKLLYSYKREVGIK